MTLQGVISIGKHDLMVFLSFDSYRKYDRGAHLKKRTHTNINKARITDICSFFYNGVTEKLSVHEVLQNLSNSKDQLF